MWTGLRVHDGRGWRLKVETVCAVQAGWSPSVLNDAYEKATLWIGWPHQPAPKVLFTVTSKPFYFTLFLFDQNDIFCSPCPVLGHGGVADDCKLPRLWWMRIFLRSARDICSSLLTACTCKMNTNRSLLELHCRWKCSPVLMLRKNEHPFPNLPFVSSSSSTIYPGFSFIFTDQRSLKAKRYCCKASQKHAEERVIYLHPKEEDK